MELIANGDSTRDTENKLESIVDLLEKSDAREYYVVEKGDTLARILRRLGSVGLSLSSEDLLSANPGANPARLRVGQKLFLPSPAADPTAGAPQPNEP